MLDPARAGHSHPTTPMSVLSGAKQHAPIGPRLQLPWLPSTPTLHGVYLGAFTASEWYQLVEDEMAGHSSSPALWRTLHSSGAVRLRQRKKLLCHDLTTASPLPPRYTNHCADRFVAISTRQRLSNTPRRPAGVPVWKRNLLNRTLLSPGRLFLGHSPLCAPSLVARFPTRPISR